MSAPSRAAVLARFERHVEKTQECWIWHGSISNGRPKFGRIAGRDSPQKLASHVAWWLEFDYWPTQLNHVCENGGVCVNPFDCYEGDQSQNMADYAAHATCSRGHLWTANGYTRPNGRRFCRACRNENRRSRALGTRVLAEPDFEVVIQKIGGSVMTQIAIFPERT